MQGFSSIHRNRKKFVLLLAVGSGGVLAMLSASSPAQAILVYNIYESGGNLILQAGGTLNLPASIGTDYCNQGDGNAADGGFFQSTGPLICTGPDATVAAYRITGPNSFEGNSSLGPADAVSGITTYLGSTLGGLTLSIGPYTSGQPIASIATFNGQTLAGIGITSPLGTLLGEWILDGATDKIQLIVGAPNPGPAAVPGPLPLFGAAAAFGMSRRLRRRINLG